MIVWPRRIPGFNAGFNACLARVIPAPLPYSRFAYTSPPPPTQTQHNSPVSPTRAGHDQTLGAAAPGALRYAPLAYPPPGFRRRPWRRATERFALGFVAISLLRVIYVLFLFLCVIGSRLS